MAQQNKLLTRGVSTCVQHSCRRNNSSSPSALARHMRPVCRSLRKTWQVSSCACTPQARGTPPVNTMIGPIAAANALQIVSLPPGRPCARPKRAPNQPSKSAALYQSMRRMHNKQQMALTRGKACSTGCEWQQVRLMSQTCFVRTLPPSPAPIGRVTRDYQVSNVTSA